MSETHPVRKGFKASLATNFLTLWLEFQLKVSTTFDNEQTVLKKRNGGGKLKQIKMNPVLNQFLKTPIKPIK